MIRLIKWGAVIGLLSSAALLCARAGESDRAMSSSLLRACATAKEIKATTTIGYSDDMAGRSRVRWSRIDWLQLFPKRYVYSIPELDVQLYERKLPVPAGFDPAEDAAFLIGRVTMAVGSRCGLVVLEEGYYSSTRVVLYPVNSDGKALTGLELADFFADEDERIEIKSRFQGGKDFLIRTMLRKSIVVEHGGARKRAAESIQLWRFEEQSGFTRVR